MATPELRFKGFEGEWSEKQLEEVANRVTKKNTDNAISETFTNSAVQGIVSQLDFFTHSLSNQANISGYYVVSPEDFVYNPRISQKAPYGPINRNKNGRTGVISPLYSVFSINGLNHRFSEWFFKSSRWHDFMRQNGDSGARHDRFSIGSDEFFKMPINIPNASEQKEIGVYLESLENSCVASASAVQKIKLLKQSMLVKMFPQDGASVPEIRFEGFTGDWDKKKIEDVAPLQRGFDLPNSQMRAGKVPVVGSNGIFAFHDEAPVKGPGVMTGRSGTIGKIHFVEEDYWPHNTALWVTSFRGNKPEFIFYLYQSLKVEKFASGSGVPTLNRNDVHSSFTYVPSFSEQAAIGSYLRQLDKLIELEEAKLAKLTQLKTAFLSKMFV